MFLLQDAKFCKIFLGILKIPLACAGSCFLKRVGGEGERQERQEEEEMEERDFSRSESSPLGSELALSIHTQVIREVDRGKELETSV